MKFSCKTSDLLQALSLASRAISGQQALPILGNVLIAAEGNQCTLSATDLELSIITSFEASIENEGTITVPAKAILNFSQYNSDPEVLLETVEGTQLKCSSRRGKTTIAGESASEYPTIASIEKKTAFSLEAAPLLDALTLVTFTCAKSTLRPVLAGVFVHREKDALVFAATDSYRLSEYRVTSESGEELSCIIPVKVLDELKMTLSAARKTKESKGGEDGGENKKKSLQVQVTLSTQQIEFMVGNTRLLSRLIDGKFPDYHQIIPVSSPTHVTLPVGELLTNTKRMHYFAKEVNNTLAFHISSSEVVIRTPATPLGRDEVSMPAEVTGEPSKIALSSTYLLDFLGHVSSDSLLLEMQDSMHAALFRIPGNSSFLHLIMPLRMQEE